MQPFPSFYGDGRCFAFTLRAHLALLKLENRGVTALVLLACPPGILALPMPAVAPKCNTELLRAQAILRWLSCSQPSKGLSVELSCAAEIWWLRQLCLLCTVPLQCSSSPPLAAQKSLCGKSTHSSFISQERMPCMCFPGECKFNLCSPCHVPLLFCLY